MAQKNKVKELVGRGLNSYHTKALQQMDRIEKKNKEQNHKISILSNELDNDYLTKTEEGSVISLEHSKEGMVYLDELQGNTLVNYCTDGSKELTLNGDIDVEGTFITTTEGVDNGKVDVMCEGNTLVNLVNKIQDYKGNAGLYGWQNTPSNCKKYEWVDNGIKIYSTLQDTSTDRYFRSTPYENGIFKPNRTYIVRMNVSASDLNVSASILRCFYGNGKVFMSGSLQDVENGVFVKKATTSSDLNVPHSMISLDYIRALNTEGWVSFQNVIVIDVTDLPSYQQDVEYWRNIEYFEGMKSVGQDDENGHKIEILSRNKNLFDISKFKIGSYGEVNNGTITVKNPTVGNWDSAGTYEFIVPNYMKGKKLSLKSTIDGSGGIEIRQYDKNRKQIFVMVANTYTFDILNDCYSINLNFNSRSHGVTTTWSDIQLELSDLPTDYISHANNKKEILINEPLRKGNTEVKDRIIKLNNKWYIERNYEEIVIDGSYTWKINGNGTIYYATTIFGGNKYVLPTLNNKMCNMVCDKRIVTYIDYIYAKEPNSIVGYIGITKDGNLGMSLDNKTPEQIKSELTSNPIRIILQLKTPTYEPLELEPILNTYNDVTHISNNSIIPCNMKIQNTGYNAIIKPNTLYTVALDTNKGGTVGMNLGGAKGTTTNNVLKLTTPATLADDSLRLYGKGIKGSKVRLLEGDKTNWIPSHFEGMKSSFEDKVQEDGSYKMEILSNNKNLFDIDAEYYKAGWGNQNYQRNGNGFSFDAMDGWSSIGYEVKGHRNKTIVVSATVTCINKDTSKSREQSLRVHTETWSGANGTSFLDGETKRIKFNVKLNHEGRVYFNGSSTPEGSNNGGVKWTVKDILIEDVDGGTGYFPRECNKIQFSSIEPLRGVGTARDRFVFIDNKLKIERNVGSYTINGTEQWYYALDPAYVNHNNIYFRTRNLVNDKKTLGAVRNDKLPNYIDDILWSNDRMGFGTNDQYFVNGFCVRLPRRIVGNGTRAEMERNCKEWLSNNNLDVVYALEEPTYEEVPYELQKIILEGYENGTLFIDTNIPPTSKITYAGETPIVKSVKLNKTEVLNNTEDINDNIIPYLMDMDYRVVMLQLATEELEGGVSMARLFGGTYEMIKRDILSKRLTREEYGHRLADYFNAGKLTEEQVRELEDLR